MRRSGVAACKAFIGACAVALIALIVLGGSPVQAEFDQVLAAIQKGDFARAVPELHTLAGAGDPRAQDTLAGLYLQGIGVERDVPLAMEWYCRVAHHVEGGAQAMHAVWFLAEYFRTGGGLPGPTYGDGRPEQENPLRAYFWFSVMAEQSQRFERVDEPSAILGKIGVNAVGGVLFDEEKLGVREALMRWRPTRPVDSGDACLALPEGLTAP